MSSTIHFPSEQKPARRDDLTGQQTKNDAAQRLIETWLADDSGYDEAAWPRVKRAIEENRPSYRSRFGE